MKKKSMTIEDIGKKIDLLDSKFSDQLESLAVSTARSFESNSIDFSIIRKDISKIKTNLDDMDSRLGKIEGSSIRRLDKIEDDMRIIKTTFEKNLKIKLPK